MVPKSATGETFMKSVRNKTMRMLGADNLFKAPQAKYSVFGEQNREDMMFLKCSVF